jgi:hypothetical protein
VDQRIHDLVSEWIIPTDSRRTKTTILLMTCHDLARRLNELQPDLSPVDVARLSLMILSQSDDMTRLSDDEVLMSVWKSASFRLEAASDQHAAVAEELDAICGNGPIRFTPDQLWVLLRAVKVQSQILELYTDEPALA